MAEQTAATPAARPSHAPSEREARLDWTGAAAGAQLRRSESAKTTMELMQHLAGAGSPSVEQRRGGGMNTGAGDCGEEPQRRRRRPLLKLFS